MKTVASMRILVLYTTSMSKENTSAEQLLAIYNQIDAYLRTQYRQDVHADHGFLVAELARSNRVVARHQQELRAISQLRNSLVHNPMASLAQPFASPHPLIVERYGQIRDALLHPANALSVAIPAAKIYTAKLSSNLVEIITTMDKNTYTHVPIIENDKMVGVFSENTLLSYLAEHGEAVITKDMTVATLGAFIPLSAHRSETFAFLPRNASFGEVFEIFNKAIKVRQRIGMVFITQTGKSHEKPLGIITAWDLASPDFENN